MMKTQNSNHAKNIQKYLSCKFAFGRINEAIKEELDYIHSALNKTLLKISYV